MATQYGDNATKRSVNKPSEKIDSSDDRGRVRVSHDEITPSANIPVADKIILGRLPKGARLLYAKVAGTVSAGAADLGWEAGDGESADPDGIAAAQALSANALVLPADKKMDAEVDISATVTTEIVADGKVSVSVYYSLD